MTRNRAPVTPPVVMTIAGSDSGGGAGIQADLKTIEAGGAFGTSAITSVTAQHTRGVESTHVLPTAEIEAQCQAVRDDFDLGAVKTGMLATREIVELVTEQVSGIDAPAVIDPVMVAASGDRLLDEAAETAYEALIAEATVVTPNADEASVLTSEPVDDLASAEAAGEHLVEMGADTALVKGGHIDGADVVDTLVTAETVETIRHPRVETDATHGSGCMLASAIATRLAYGEDVPTAVRTGVELLGRAVRYSLDVGEGPGAVHHLVATRDRAEREPTTEAVHRMLNTLIQDDYSELIPEVGMNVAGATPYAETPREIAAVDGRIRPTLDGLTADAVRFGASTHVANVLLASREHDANLRFACNTRFDDTVELALESLEWPVGRFDPTGGSQTGSMQRAIDEAFDSVDGQPVAIVDGGSHGTEAMCRLLAPDAEALLERIRTLQKTIGEGNSPA